MLGSAETVAVVVDPHSSEQLRSLVKRCEVWAVDSALNRAFAESYWSELANSSGLSLTIFDSSPGESPPDTVLRMLDMIDLHHPHCTRYEFVGVHLTPHLGEELARLGYVELSSLSEGFSASKPAP